MLSSIAEELDFLCRKRQSNIPIASKLELWFIPAEDPMKDILFFCLLKRCMVVNPPRLACSVDWKTDCPTRLLSKEQIYLLWLRK